MREPRALAEQALGQSVTPALDCEASQEVREERMWGCRAGLLPVRHSGV